MPILDSLKSGNKKILVLGSGALTIGQAGEFDYSGSQAVMALEEEGFEVIVVNPNIATVQTNTSENRKVYLYPVNAENVTYIIEKERPAAIIGGFGGQTALNCLIELEKLSILKKYNVISLGTPVKTLITTEDRKLFADKMSSFDIKCLPFNVYTSKQDVQKVAQTFDYPVIVRSAYALGGLGSGFANNISEVINLTEHALSINPQVIIEKSLAGWKELEYEVMRDSQGNTICICNMENLDPLGIHTGDSIVIAPSQTINDQEYQLLRDVAIQIVNKLQIVGECNVQFALNPESLEYYVIEINARLSRSSALASKATGYPIAYVAAKVVLGYSLLELKNPLTKNTSAFFEPSLDYVTIKVPKWDLDKFSGAYRFLDSKMKSVGEVMSIGRTFPEAFQKAIRMVLEKPEGILYSPFSEISDAELEKELEKATDKRIFAVFEAFKRKFSLEKIFSLTKITPWFLEQIKLITKTCSEVRSCRNSNSGVSDYEAAVFKLDSLKLLKWKKLGFSDRQIASLLSSGDRVSALDLEQREELVRLKRHAFKIRPVIKKIDTVASEFPTTSNYLYLTYHGAKNDVIPSVNESQSFLLLGSGPYRIGSSVEFDWCGVSASQFLKKNKMTSIVLNCNPETVSTDYNTSDRLYFDEINNETILEIYEFENPTGVITCFGGQLPNNLVPSLKRLGIRLYGHSADAINLSENRILFSSCLDELGIKQPAWVAARSDEEIKRFLAVSRFPILVRPSFVLSGTAMKVTHDIESLTAFISKARAVAPDSPIILTEFISGAKEFEMDGVAQSGNTIIAIVSEHIENAGVHSGDATITLPVQNKNLELKIKEAGNKIVQKIGLNGPFNIQFLVFNDEIYVIECNARASRSFPFISKVIEQNLADLAMQVITGRTPVVNSLIDQSRIGVKAAMFSFNRLEGVDPILGVEMASTGEVGCVGKNYQNVLLRAFEATGIKLPQKGILFSAGPKEEKNKFKPILPFLKEMNIPIFATEGTANFLHDNGIKCEKIKWLDDGDTKIISLIIDKKVDFVINIPKDEKEKQLFNNRIIRQTASRAGCSLLTDADKAISFFAALATRTPDLVPEQL
ncbi:carbamoyl-phosphate synthase (glutamine-hydrolyzing) large subunit [bacterium]|nr:carbamoyl-phosphate synthase (glutamine-hydrolyzing) large subunit [bacterium]